MKLTVIIVSYNTKEILKKAIESLQIKSDIEIIVVDNASSDGSVEMIKKSFPHIKLIENKINVGFARANNQAIKSSKGRYVLLLNSDTLVLPDSIDKVVAT